MGNCTVVIARTAAASPEEKEFEERLVQLLSSGRFAVLEVPDIYHLTFDDASAARLREIEGPIVLFSRLFPRAAFWVLRALGVEGTYAESLAANGVERPVVCHNFAEKCCPDRWREALEELVPPSPENGGTLARLDGPQRERWYPVIDYERCANCLQCLEFCLFGVYDADDSGRLIVTNPDACKPGCPACSRVCPARAIMFPLCDDAAIAGSSEGSIEPFDPAMVEKVKEQYASGTADMQDIVTACSCGFTAGASAGALPCGCSADPVPTDE